MNAPIPTTVCPVRLTLATPSDFDFRTAVCSHGFFMLAPNRWDPRRAELETAVTLDDARAAVVTIRAPRPGTIRVASQETLPRDHRRTVRSAVRRVLRLDEDLSPFHTLCQRSPTHRRAARIRFGRLIRSASLFEDAVKVICTCNVGWRQTVGMIDRVVEYWGVPTADPARRGLPTPARRADGSTGDWRSVARVGYRAEFLHRLANDAADARLDLDALDRFTGTSDDLYKRLRAIHGVGDYAAANLCMLLGRYDRLAIDTELVRFLKQRYPRRRFTPVRARAHYAPWKPYAFLAYWFELWQDYVSRHGQSDQWSPDGVGRDITSQPR